MATSSTEVNLSDSRQGSLYAADITSFIIALLAFGLRIWARVTTINGLWLDDWFMCVAMIGAIAMLANFCRWIPHGHGKHIQAFGPKADYYFFLGFFMAELIYTFIIVFVKYSILALSWRVSKSTSIKLPLAILAAIVTSWGIAVFLLSILTCVPPKGFWEKNLNASCNVNSQEFLFGISIPNILTDVTLLVFPIPYILRLNTNVSQKRLLIGTFLLGSFVCLASILRLVSVLYESSDPDFSWNWVDQGIWAVVESNLAIVSADIPACLPTLRPAWKYILKRLFPKKAISIATPKPKPPPGVLSWTFGSGPSRRKRNAQITLDESLSTTHPFTTLNNDEEQGSGDASKKNLMSINETDGVRSDYHGDRSIGLATLEPVHAT